MNGLLALSAAILVSLLVSKVLIRILTQPLRQILAQLCPGEGSVNFWIAFTTIMLYLAPLLFSVLFVMIPSDPSAVSVLRSALGASLAGAFAAMLVVGYQISQARHRMI